MNEQSIISRTSTEDNRFAKDTIMGKAKKIDKIFPYFDYINRFVHINQSILTIIMFFQMAQIIILSYWPFSKFYQDVDDNHFILLIFKIFLTVHPKENRDVPPGFYINFIVALLSMIWTALFAIYFHYNRRFVTWTMYISYILNDILGRLFMIPSAFILGVLFQHLINGRNFVVIVLIIVMLIVVIWFLALYTILILISSRNVNARCNYTTAFDAKLLLILPISTLFIPFCQVLFSKFPPFSIILFVLLHIFACIYFLMNSFSFGFHMFHTNCVMTAVGVEMIVGDIMSYIGIMFQEYIPVYVPLVVGITSFFIALLVFEILFHKQRKIIISNLTHRDESTPYDDKYKFEFFTHLGLDLSERKALAYLRIGFTNICDYFLDFSFLTFVVENYSSSAIMAQLIVIIAYFPSESRKLNALLGAFVQRRDLSFSDRFLIFSVYRIKTLRQSSVSADTTERINLLKQQSRNLENEIRGFWSVNSSTLGFLEEITQRFKYISILWEEAVRDFPNNAKVCDELVRFHIECTTQFDRAIYYKLRAQKIEHGMSFTKDYAFIALVRSFPYYLKKKYLDVKGNIIVRRRRNKNRNSSSSSQSSNRGSSNDESSIHTEIEIEQEVTIGKAIINQSKVRLALHRAIQNRRSSHSTKFSTVMSIITVILSLSAAAVSIIMVENIRNRTANISYLKSIARLRYMLPIIQTQEMVRYSYENGQVDPDKINSAFDTMYKEDGFNESMFDYRQNIIMAIISNLVAAEGEIKKFMASMGSMASGEMSVYDTLARMINPESKAITCVNGKPIGYNLQPLQDILMNHIWNEFDMFIRIWETEPIDLLHHDRFCEITNNALTISEGLDAVLTNLTVYEELEEKKQIESYTIALYTVPTIVVIINFIPSIVIIGLYVKEVRSVLDMLTSMPRAAKEECKKPIMKDIDEDTAIATEPMMGHSMIGFFVVFTLITSLVLAAQMVTFIILGKRATKKLGKINAWLMYSSKRMGYAPESVSLVIYSLLGGLNPDIIDVDQIKKKAIQSLENMEIASKNLSDGTSITPACYGFDPRLDKLNSESVCKIESNASETHDNYRCSSVSAGISNLRSLSLEVLANHQQLTSRPTNRLDSELVYHMLHSAGSHTFEKIDIYNDLLVTISGEVGNDLKFYWFICLFIILIYVIGQIVCICLVKRYIERTYVGLMCIIKHVAPLQIMQNKRLLDFLLNRKGNNKDGKMEIAQSVIYGSSDSIFCSGLNGVVEIVNPSVTQTFGYTPEQMLGQPIYSIFTSKDEEAISKQMEMMASGQASPFFETETAVISDNSVEVACNLTILAMTGASDSTIESFVFIIRDETEIIEQRKKAECAKAQSENLLYQILPRDIVSRINSGEKDISFSVPSATIIFIDVNRFSEYCTGLQPEQIMLSLSTLFASFDKLIKKYPSLIKVKLIGDIYMAAGGLFALPDEPPKIHAEQAVNFALNCIEAIDEVNIKLNSGLQVRVGINTGGPLIAGVLGTDKPVFDIIGDPINVAARLQSTDVPGNVQVSRYTADLLDQNNFSVEPRGEVYLKGKGNQLTYFVSPPVNFMSSFSTIDLPTIDDRKCFIPETIPE